jgi:hypothetical protein
VSQQVGGTDRKDEIKEARAEVQIEIILFMSSSKLQYISSPYVAQAERLVYDEPTRKKCYL